MTEFRNNQYNGVHWNSMTFSKKRPLWNTNYIILFAAQYTFVLSDSDDATLQYVQLLITATEE